MNEQYHAVMTSVPRPQEKTVVASSDCSPGTFKEGPKDLAYRDPLQTPSLTSWSKPDDPDPAKPPAHSSLTH